MPLLNVTDLYSSPAEGPFMLKGISFTQEKYQRIAISGETGSGKSTLLKLIAGLLHPASGEMQFEDKKLRGPHWQLIPGHEGMAYLSQHFELLHNYRMEELLAYGNEFSPEDAADIYSVCRIDHLFKRRSDELSGGEKQRIALAKLLVSKPRLLLLDEPYSNLDLIHKKILKEVLDDISARLQITCILASHDPGDILPWADEILILQNGELVQKADPNTIYNKPVNEYVAGLFDDHNIIPAELLSLFPGITHLIDGKGSCRPQQIQVSEAETPISGTVTSCEFYGNYFKLTVSVEETDVILHSDTPLPIGTLIFLK